MEFWIWILWSAFSVFVGFLMGSDYQKNKLLWEQDSKLLIRKLNSEDKDDS